MQALSQGKLGCPNLRWWTFAFKSLSNLSKSLQTDLLDIANNAHGQFSRRPSLRKISVKQEETKKKLFRKKKTSSSSVPKLVFTYQNNKEGDGDEEIITSDTEPEMDFGSHLNVEPDTMSIISKHSSLDVRTLMDRMETVRIKHWNSSIKFWNLKSSLNYPWA